MSRFILNLRQITEQQGELGAGPECASRFSRFTAPNFQIPDIVVGNLGEELRVREDDEHDDTILVPRTEILVEEREESVDTASEESPVIESGTVDLRMF